MEIILDNIKHPDFYNKCDICDRTRNLHECNICLDLYCIKCERFKKNMCSYCYDQITTFVVKPLTGAIF